MVCFEDETLHIALDFVVSQPPALRTGSLKAFPCTTTVKPSVFSSMSVKCSHTYGFFCHFFSLSKGWWWSFLWWIFFEEIFLWKEVENAYLWTVSVYMFGWCH